MDQPMPGRDPLDLEETQFEEAAASARTCRYCECTISDAYYDVNGETSCETCHRQMQSTRTAGTKGGRVSRSLLFGGIGGGVGAAIYYAVLAITEYEIGLIALLVGFLVGLGVRVGSGGSGGRGYQVLAAAMTYIAIVSTYVPFILDAIVSEPEAAAETRTVGDAGVLAAEESSTPAQAEHEGAREAGETSSDLNPGVDAEPLAEEATLGTFVLAVMVIMLAAMVTPFLAGFENIVGIVIIGVAVYAAWQMNAHQPYVVEGPFRVGANE